MMSRFVFNARLAKLVERESSEQKPRTNAVPVLVQITATASVIINL